jgi:hypothetical protein
MAPRLASRLVSSASCSIMRRRTGITLGLAWTAAASLISCHADRVEAPGSRQKPLFAILDAAHGGAAHFFFLPPTVIPAAPPTFSGTFDGTLNAIARVCQGTGPCNANSALAVFTAAGGTGGGALARVMVYPALQAYVAAWDTRQCTSGPCTLDPAQAYRLHIYASGTLGGEVELGFADIKVLLLPAPDQPPPSVDLGNYSPLVQNLPYIIAFRIEQGVSLAPPVPALPPESVPASIWAQLYAPANISPPTADWGVPFPRNLAIVAFKPQATQMDRQSAISAVGGTVVGGEAVDSGGYYYVLIKDDGTARPLFQAISKLQSLPQVDLASPDLPAVTTAYLRPHDGVNWQNWHVNPDSAAGQKWGLEATAMPLAWGCSTGDSTLRVGVLDHAFYSVSDFAGNIDPASNANFGSVVGGAPHGTEVASIVGARGNNGQGMTGVMWRAQLNLEEYVLPGHNSALVAVHRLRNLALANTRVTNFSAGLYWTVQFGHLPAATHADSQIVEALYRPFRRELQLETTLGTHMLLVLSAGNDGVDAFWSALPRLVNDFPNQVLVVASSDSGGGLSAFSDTGALVTVAAPGARVGALNAAGTVIRDSGTSFAAPIVTGIAGLALSFDPTLTTAITRSAVVQGAIAGGRRARSVPIVNGYQTLRAVAARPGAPICGNRVWARGTNIYAQRDTTSAAGDLLVNFGDSALYINVFHGGHRFETYGSNFVKVAFRYANPGPWQRTSDTAVTPPGGTYLSLVGASHDQDSSADVSATYDYNQGSVALDVGVRTRTTLRQTLTTITVSLAMSDTACVYMTLAYTDTSIYTGLPQYHPQSCNLSTTGGRFETADWRLAFAPYGGRILVAVSRTQHVVTSLGPFGDCAFGLPNSIAKCRTVSSLISSEGADIWSVPTRGGPPTLIGSVPKQVFWLAGSEDGTQIVLGEGILQQTFQLVSMPPPTTFQTISGPQVISACGVTYRPTGNPSAPALFAPTDNVCRGLQGQGTIAPDRLKP